MSNEVDYESAVKFLEMLKEKLPDWSYDNYDAEIEYIKEVLWIDNDMRNS
jgi:hypothetical protein